MSCIHKTSLKVVHHLKIYRHAKFHGSTLTGESFVSTIAKFKSPIEKIMIKIKLVCMFMIFHCRKRYLSTRCNGS
jgi:hypothetical protein